MMADGADCDSIRNAFFGVRLFNTCTGDENSEGGLLARYITKMFYCFSDKRELRRAKR